MKIDFFRFCLVGASGFVINFSLLTIFYRIFNWPLFWSQLLAAEISLFTNFLLHHTWTYKANKVDKTMRQLLIQFHMSSWVAIIGSAAIVSGGVRWLNMSYLIALVFSSAIALLWNFSWTKFVIWRHNQEQDSEL